MKYRSIFHRFQPVLPWIILSAIFLSIQFGCEPISVPNPPNAFDRQSIVTAYVSPDTVAAGVPFIVQISYKPDCQGYLAGVRRDFDSIRTLLLFTPILHINPDQQCVPKAPVVTVAETLQFDSPGFDTIGVSGQEGVSYKQLLTQNGYINPPVFHFHLLFVNNQGYVPLHSSTFQRLDNSVVIPITADTLGNWDSVFTDSNSKIRYKIGQNTFEATKGITESVVVILQ